MPRSGYIRELRRQVGHRLLTVPSVTAAVFDHDWLFMLQHTDGDLWAPPGGTIEPGETPADAVVREMWEETRLLVTPVAIIGVFGGPDFDVVYDNGDMTTYVMTVFECRVESGQLQLDPDEVSTHAYLDQAAAHQAHAAPWVAKVLPELFDWNRRVTDRQARFAQPEWAPHSHGPR